MSDYISRDAAIERFCNIYCGCTPEECGFKIPQDGAEECAAVRALKDTPAADVVEVVRCKDCLYYNTTGCADGYGWCEDPYISKGVCDGFYCAGGERRTNGQKETSANQELVL